MPKAKQKLHLNSILFIYEMAGERTDVFFIDDGMKIDKEVRRAMSAARNTMVNVDELTPEQDLAHDVLNAAMTDEDGAKYLDDIHLPFQGMLLPFKITDQKSLQTSAKLNFVKCGIVV